MLRPTAVTTAEIERIRQYAPLIASVCVGDPSDIDYCDTYDFAALGARETEWATAPGYAPHGDPFGRGDGGHGYGIFQIDDRTYPGEIAAVEQLRHAGAGAALRRMFEYALGDFVSGRRALLGSMRRNGIDLSPSLLRRATFAAYNAGPGRVYRFAAEGHDFDALTTGADYSKWCVAKAEALRAAAPDLFA